MCTIHVWLFSLKFLSKVLTVDVDVFENWKIIVPQFNILFIHFLGVNFIMYIHGGSGFSIDTPTYIPAIVHVKINRRLIRGTFANNLDPQNHNVFCSTYIMPAIYFRGDALFKNQRNPRPKNTIVIAVRGLSELFCKINGANGGEATYFTRMFHLLNDVRPKRHV